MTPKAKAKKGKKQVSSRKKPERAAKNLSDATADSRIQEAQYIVGIGASAGGLEALQEFFEGMPQDHRVGFVVIPHLDPKHASLMPQLLQKCTKMEVFEGEDGKVVQPGQVFVAPPGSGLGIMHGKLQLIQLDNSSQPRAPINYFFRLLAQDQRDHAICIVLSGTGSDGTEGLKAVKGELGMVMVQEPASAKFDGMPRSALQTGLADYVLPPPEMPGRLLDYLNKHLQRKAVPFVEPAPGVGQEVLSKVLMSLRSQTGHDFSGYKRSTILRRIERRMNVHQIDNVSDYVRLLFSNAGEAKALFKELLIGVTSFFRDSEAFETLRQKALLPFLKSKPTGYAFRAWVVGCSGGEEAYSLAILIRECMDELQRADSIQIFATDIDEEAIHRARAGIYPGDITVDLGGERLKRFFDQVNDSYQVKREIREMIVFASQSVIKDPPFTKLDLICCRNLLIYLGGEVQKKLLPLFHFSLKPEGFLMLGTSETVGRFTDLFSSVDDKFKIYRRKAVSSGIRPIMDFPLAPLSRTDAKPSVAQEKTLSTLPRLVELKMLQEFSPACVVISREGDILHVHGHTSKYLEFPSGKPSVNLFDVAKQGLRSHLHRLVREAVARKRDAIHPGARLKINGATEKVDLIVAPIAGIEADGVLMVVFQDAGVMPARDDRKDSVNKPDNHLEELRQELSHTKENLRTTIEELETANEELRATNEEYQSNNEELQSANEELTSSKEELQSLNEELESVNSELQNKNLELIKGNAEMKNLLDSIEIPAVFLDGSLCIRRFTSSMDQIMHLKPSDLGRHFGDLFHQLKAQDLLKEAKGVLDKLAPKEVEAQSREGRRYKIRMRPYRTSGNVIDGLVITFVDINKSKTVQA
jgi:two-component system CheB/CheR fusion protein